jgi:FixJ family two-component response regulator
MGLVAVAFASAEAFLDSASVARTSCLVLDVQMPGMGGLTLQRHLAASGRQIPIVFVTGYPDAHVRDKAMNSGAVCFLTKPFNEDDLVDGLRSALTPSR